MLFQRNFPVSQAIIGATLGVISAPQCKICARSDHYHCECLQEWGRIGQPLPGFARDGTRIGNMWHSKSNEPLQKTMKAWVAFLSDMSNFAIPSPLPAEVAGTPTLAGLLPSHDLFRRGNTSSSRALGGGARPSGFHWTVIFRARTRYPSASSPQPAAGSDLPL